MHIFLIRHGESKGNLKPGYLSGRTDPDGLSDNGIRQVVRMAWELRQEKIDTIFSSPVVRAHESALILQKLLGGTVSLHSSFSELHYGIFERHYWWEMKHRVPKNWREKFQEDYSTPYPEGESFEHLVQRSWKGFMEVIAGCNGTVVIVTHQAVIASLLYCIEHNGLPRLGSSFMQYLHQLKIPNGKYWKISLLNGDRHDVSRFRITAGASLSGVLPTHATLRFYVRGMGISGSSPSFCSLSSVSSNKVYRLSSSHPLLVKILKEKEAVSGKRLVLLYRYLESFKHISAPKVVSYDDSKIFFSNTLLVQDYEKGTTLRTCLFRHPSHTVSLLRKLRDSLVAIHSLAKTDVCFFWHSGNVGVGDEADWSKFILDAITHTSSSMKKISIPDDSRFTLMEGLHRLIHRLQTDPPVCVPLHGDVTPANIIVSHRGTACRFLRLLDFERVRMGDPVWDFAYFLGFVQREHMRTGVVWQDLVFSSLSEKQRLSFRWYLLLFHAWSVRDMLDYPHQKERVIAGKRSLSILSTLRI